MLLTSIFVLFAAFYQNSVSASFDVYAAYVSQDGSLGNWASTSPSYMILNSTRVGVYLSTLSSICDSTVSNWSLLRLQPTG
jgi:hypothetical protein